MEENRKHREPDQLFRDAFAEFEATPSPAVWENVEKALDERGNRRPGMWWFYGMLVLVLGLGAAWWFWPEAVSPGKEKAVALVTEKNRGKAV